MRRSISLLTFVTVIALIAACDSGGGGGSERFSSVEIFASYDSSPYEADAWILSDSSDPSDPDNICDSSTTTADNIDTTVTSMAYDPLPEGVIPCDVNILRYTLEYFPQSPAPPIPSKRVHQQINIPAPGGAGGTLTTTVAIRILEQNTKAYLNAFYFDSLDPPGCPVIPEFQYDVKVSMTMEEVCTEIKEQVQFWVALRYFDAKTTDTCELRCTPPPP